MIVIFIAKIITLLIALSHGWSGSIWHIGFTVLSRFTFGIFAYPIQLQRIICCIIWYSVQSLTAGQNISLILSSIFPSFFNLKNTLPESFPIDTKQLIGFFLYHIISFPFLMIPPEKLKGPFKFVTLFSAAAIFGTSIGCMVNAHGAGDLLHSKSTISSGSNLGMAFMHGINSVINSIAVGLLNQPDFSRFVSRPGQQIWGQTVSILFLGNIVPLFGLLGTSAAIHSYNINNGISNDINYVDSSSSAAIPNLWNPPIIIEQWLIQNYNARSRCATFFAALGFLISTLGLNTIDNGISGGMDLAGILPKYINIRRGAVIIAIISIAIQPWQLIKSAGVFLNVLGSYGLFIGPMIGVFTCDYFFVRKEKIKLGDLFSTKRDGIYWYWYGFNLRAYASWISGVIPGIVGIGSVNPKLEGKIPSGAIKVFQISFVIGYVISFLMHLLLSRVLFPPQGTGEVDTIDYYGTFTEKEALKLGIEPNDKSLIEVEETISRMTTTIDSNNTVISSSSRDQNNNNNNNSYGGNVGNIDNNNNNDIIINNDDNNNDDGTINMIIKKDAVTITTITTIPIDEKKN